MKPQAYFTRRVLRVGFSTGLTVPAPLGRALGIRPGDEVRMYMVGEVLCVQRLGSEGFVPKVVPVRIVERHVEIEEVREDETHI